MTTSTKRHMLTTIDNPFHPYKEFDEWRRFDESKGYYSNSLLARIVVTSDELSDEDQEEAIELAILEIVKENVSGMHKRVEIE